MNDLELLENQIIGAFILDKTTHIYIKQLNEDFFNLNSSKIIFKVIKDLYLKKENIDLLTVNNKICAINTDKTNVLSKLIEITDNVITTADIKVAIDKIKDIHNRKMMQEIIIKANKDIKNVDKTVNDIKKNLINDIKNIKSDEVIKISNMQDALIEVLDDIEKKEKKGEDYSLYTGFFDLDKYTDGLHNSELTCIGARPATGKTAFALNIAINIAKRKKKVYFCSLEMSTEQIMQRIISNFTNINTQFLRTGRLEENEKLRIAENTEKILNLELKIDTNTRYIEELENIISIQKEKEEIDVLIVDYLTLLKSKEKFPIRELEVAEISRKLKLLALDLKIPIIILVQLNRDAENKVPSMANIRESGSIEQNCDNIIFLHNEDNSNNMVNEITVILEKQRQGMTGSLKLKFDKKHSKFLNLEK